MMSSRRSARFLLVSWLAVAGLLLAVPALAQVAEKEEMADFTFGGPVVSVDVANRTITIGSDTGGTFEVDPDATLLSGDQKLELGDLEVGANVEGNGDVRGPTNPRKVITYLEEVAIEK